MELKIKYITPYLNHKVKIYRVFKTREFISTLDFSNIYNLIDNSIDAKIILKPLNDITFEQLGILKNKYDLQVLDNDNASLFRDIDGNTNPLEWAYQDVQKLIEWHFDIFGLIEKGLAIDINTIKIRINESKRES